MIILMLRSFYHVLGKENIKKITIEYSISNGLFAIMMECSLDNNIIKEVKEYMKVLVEKDIPILKRVLELMRLLNYLALIRCMIRKDCSV